MKALFQLYYRVCRIIGKEKTQEWINTEYWQSLDDCHKDAILAAYEIYYWNKIYCNNNNPLDHRLMVYKVLKTYNLI